LVYTLYCFINCLHARLIRVTLKYQPIIVVNRSFLACDTFVRTNRRASLLPRCSSVRLSV